MKTDEIWFWTKDQVRSYGWKGNFFIEVLIRLAGLLEIIVGIFLISNITAIYIKMTIICAPIFILIISKIIQA